MDKKQPYRIYKEADFEQYVQGTMLPKDMHALERQALEDPFTQDALEGYLLRHKQNNKLAMKPLAGDNDNKQTASKTPIAMLVKSKPLQWIAAAAIITGVGWFLLSNPAREAGLHKQQETVHTTTTDSVALQAKEQETTATELANDKKPQDQVAYDPLPTQITKKIPSMVAEPMPKNAATETGQVQAEVALAEQQAKKHEENAILESKQADESQDIAARHEAQTAEKAVPQVSAFTPTARAARSVAPQVAQAPALADSATAKIISGRVVDEAGNPVPFASVMLQGKAMGVSTNAKGEFSMRHWASEKDARLVASALGYTRAEVQVSGAPVDIILKLDSETLNDVVVVGYGTTRKESLFAKAKPALDTLAAAPLGGWNSFEGYIKENSLLPEDLKSKYRPVTASFEINENGRPERIDVQGTHSAEVKKEAIRLLQNGPKWIKKAKRKKRVTVIMNL